MDRKTVKKVSADSVKALEAVAKKHGLIVVSRGGKFGEDGATLKFEFSETTSDGGNAKVVNEWKRNRWHYGLNDVELGAVFLVNGTRYTIHSCKPRSPKWPIVGKGPRGGLYKFQASQVANGLI